MVLHQKYFQAADIDLKAAKILAKENLFPPTLYHLQQAYEKCIKAYYIFRLSSKGVTEKTADKKCKRFRTGRTINMKNYCDES
jgi:HEPN domain-containing protein